MSKAIELALASATTPSRDVSERAKLVAEGQRLIEIRDGLLPFEQNARIEIESKLELLRSSVANIDAAAAIGLPMLDQGVFAWTKKQVGWRKEPFGKQMIVVPRLAYVPVTSDRCELWVSHRGDVRFNNEQLGTRYSRDVLPPAVQAHYIEIMSNLSHEHLDWNGRETLNLTYTYPGVVPADVKEIIKTETESKRFDRLAFVCDVDQWQVYSTQAPREYLDPILVGEKEGRLWVITSFDPTPTEQYIASEFTS